MSTRNSTTHTLTGKVSDNPDRCQAEMAHKVREGVFVIATRLLGQFADQGKIAWPMQQHADGDAQLRWRLK